ncbi:MAG: UDP-glucose 6-dehydrogenase [Micrococcales bacterium]|nr:MAG: UDP-glucose 6-dehydrogenase [Micrococcales bacterium]PIE26858.1 MAG: UDP-glucose 6-dehydrogenase [Micrococcales bacterium]
MRVGVIGCGYLGAVHAACMVELGHDVVGVDVDQRRIEALSSGRAPFFEPGLPELLDGALQTSRLRFTTDAACLDGCTAIFICVGTPQRKGELAADTSYVRAAVDAVIDHVTEPALVIGKSTVPVGTAAELTRILAPHPQFRLAWNPEFLREGYAVEDTLRPDRLVFGVAAEQDEASLREIYQAPIAAGCPVIVTDLATSELVKVAANAFLATKISFINAMSEVCESAGADVTQLADAIGYDDRIGRKFLGAGLGFGGGCLPKDIRAFMARAGELGADQALTFLREVDAINMRRRARMVELAREELGGSFVGARVAVLGAAFKPLSDDIRDSPALNVAAQIRLQGGDVVVTDPEALANAKSLWPDLTYVSTPEEACAGADVVLLVTEWQQYRDLDPHRLGAVVRHRRILDGRNVLSAQDWVHAGWTYRALGRQRREPVD